MPNGLETGQQADSPPSLGLRQWIEKQTQLGWALFGSACFLISGVIAYALQFGEAVYALQLVGGLLAFYVVTGIFLTWAIPRLLQTGLEKFLDKVSKVVVDIAGYVALGVLKIIGFLIGVAFWVWLAFLMFGAMPWWAAVIIVLLVVNLASQQKF